jgi:glycosyltransferase involved in cell wall biosynthesis
MVMKLVRIVQLIDGIGGTGGLERFVHNLSKEFIAAGHETFIVTLEPAVNKNQWGTDNYPQLQLQGSRLEWQKQVSQLNPDLVMWHGVPNMAEFVLDLASTYPVVATFHGACCPSGGRLFPDKDDICFRKGGYTCLFNWYARQCGFGKSPLTAVQAIREHQVSIQALSNCKRIYAVSESVKRFLMIEGLPDENIHVFDNTLGMLSGLRTARVDRIDTKRPLNLIYVGRLVQSKGVQYFIEATRKLILRGQDVAAHIVGEGWQSHILQDMVKRFGLENKITFYGRVPGIEVKRMYDLADIVVVPSIWPDPAPLVVPEAREQGKPVVVFDAGGLPEWADFMNGVHVAPRADAAKLADVIMEVRETYAETEQDSELPQTSSCSLDSARKRIDVVKDCEEMIDAWWYPNEILVSGMKGL